jgi:hypothetical protein
MRDPTVFKPRSELATPSGIDHDYNFLHSIEHRIERSEKLIVEERSLVGEDELKLARAGEEDRARIRRKQGPQHAGEEPIQKSLQSMVTSVHRAPKGMRRNLENETSWSRNKRCIHWQVEWIREGNSGRILGKAMGTQPIGEVYAAIMEDERKRALAPEERRQEKKRKYLGGPRQRSSKKKKVDSDNSIDSLPALQDPETGAWSFTSIISSFSESIQEPKSPSGTKPTLPPSCHLYLLRPNTPSSYPKVLVPIDASLSLQIILRHRTVLEFPTVYVLDVDPQALPDHFLLERDFLKATGQTQSESDVKEKSSKEDSDDSDTSSSDSDTSTSGSDSDDEMEEGELVPTVWGARA